MAKRQITGFIHNVSPVKQARSGKTDYFTATLQQESSYKKVVVFSPQKHATLKVNAKLYFE